MQTGKNLYVAYRAESAFNTAPGTGSGKRLRVAGNPTGLQLKRALIRSGEIRSDGQTPMMRLGSHSVEGSYPLELSVGSFDDMLEAIMRATWVPAVTITQATAGLTSMRTPTTSTIEASAGSWITAGVRVGDTFRLTGFATTQNNNINLRVVSVTALIITVAGTPLTVDAAFDTTFSLIIMKKLSNPAVPVRRSFYVEQYYADLDQSEVFGGCRVSSLKITGAPDGMATAELGFVGASLTPLATGSSPYYVAPALTTSLALVWTDAALRYAGAETAVLSAFELMFDLSARTMPVIGSNVTPDVFDNQLVVSGSLSGIRQDLLNATRLQAETELEFNSLLVEPEAEPKDCISLFVPRLKLVTADPSSLGQDGALVETMRWEAGKKEGAGATGYDDTMATILTSAA